jgi:lipopolysaccharide export system protein LptA
MRSRVVPCEWNTSPIATRSRLIDEAELTQGEDRFASDRIVYNRITERVTAGTSAQGRERVKIRIDLKETE